MSNITSVEEITKNTNVQNTASANTQGADSTDFSSYLNSETTTLDAIFNKAAQTYGVDVNLLKAIAKQESNFNVNSTSHCGAMGLMQLMPGTAAELGVTDAYDPEQNVMGGAKYISSLLTKYNGNITLALAAYNAGSGNVAKYGGVPPFKETQDYVVKVMNYYQNGVSVPDTTVSSSPSSSNGQTSNYISGADMAINNEALDKAVSLAEEIFNYDDYLEFIELYLTMSSREKEQQAEEAKKEASENNTAFDGSYYAYQNIKYNNSILNLFSGAKL